jgi:hypothetical protein
MIFMNPVDKLKISRLLTVSMVTAALFWIAGCSTMSNMTAPLNAGAVKSDEVFDIAAGDEESNDDGEVEKRESSGRSLPHILIMYIPNRVLDLVDVFRIRARVGPGFALGLRATEFADLYLGSYVSIFVGLPGPRQRPWIRWPVGLESFNGAELSVLDATFDGGIGPDYSWSEFGINLHFLIIGVDLGFDPIEIADFVTGFIFINLRHDEL